VATLSVEERLAILRDYHGMTRADFAKIAKLDALSVKFVERGDGVYTEKEVNKFMTHFDLHGLPVSPDEDVVFKEGLYRFRDVIRGGDLEGAREIHLSMANIDNLDPCSPDLVMLARVFQAQLLMAENDCESAKERLDAAETYLYRADNENQYHYNYSMGIFNNKQGEYIKGTEFLEKAYELLDGDANLLPEDDVKLYYDLAMCYAHIGKPYRAIFFTEKSMQMHPEERNINRFLYLGSRLALNYIRVNKLCRAEKLLDKCMIKAKSTRDDINIGRVSFVFGYLFERSENWDLAIDYFDQALKYLAKGTDNYFAALWHKIHCITRKRKHSEAEREIEKAMDSCSTNELWQIYFKAQECYLNINRRTSRPNDSECEYIETVAIPYFRENHDHFIALEYCKRLVRHYEKSGRHAKSSQIKSIIIEILEWVFS